MDDDATLLKAYRAGSQAAFATLVARHVDWVHAAARRRLGNDAHRADDVTQAVFVALATRGPADRSEAAMAAWMFRVLRHAAANVVRSETRRRRHEAASARHEVPESDNAWAEIAPRLEALVDLLSPRDREAILLRFYRRQTNEAVGAAMGIGAEGARKRIARALDKLRAAFARAGMTMPAVAIGDALTTHAAPAAPPGLSAAIASGKASSSVAALATTAAPRPLAAYALAGAAALTVAAVAVLSQLDVRADVATTLPAPATGVAATRPSTVSLDELIAGIKANEGSITNLQVVGFHATVSRKGPNDADWKPTPLLAAGEAWYGPGGKVRIDFVRHVTRWIDGGAPYLEMAHVDAWDGQVGREIRISGTYNGRTSPDNSASLRREQSPWLRDSTAPHYTGVGFALPFLKLRIPTRPNVVVDASVSEYLAPALTRAATRPADAARWMSLAMEDVNGLETVRLSFRPQQALRGTSENAFWFAPSRGFALVRRVEEYHFTGPRGEPFDQVERLDVTELTEAAPGVWFPKRASAVRNDYESRGSLLRVDFTCDGAFANDPTFDDSIFSPPPPAGSQVRDETGPTTRQYVLFSDGSEHEMVAGKPLPLERRRPATRSAP